MTPHTRFSIACAIALIASGIAATAHAEGLRSNFAAHGSHGAAAGQNGVVADGQGNATGAARSGFTTAPGGQGLRWAQFNRTSDGAVNASGQATASGTNGSAERSGSFTRSADGSASGERSTTLTNTNTGTTFDGSASYTKGSGITRSASCKDAAGNTVACGSSR